MTACEKQLDRLLQLIAERVDLDHVEQVDQRYLRALAWEEVDHPPLVVQAEFGSQVCLGSPWDEFATYAYKTAFDDPVAMMQNMLLARVVPGLILKDDNPLSIRNDHGTIQIAGLLGGQWMLHADNYPWVEPLGSHDAIEKVASDDSPIDLTAGVLGPSTKTLQFYREKLSQFGPCRRAVQISLPDLQGPIDTADQLWGSGIFGDFYEVPQLVGKLMGRIVDVMLTVAAHYRTLSTDRLDPQANTQHGYVIPGRLMIRNDSAIMISPQMYAECIRPHDSRLLHEIGTGTIHFCGNGQHLLAPMLQIEDLRGFDVGQPELLDLPLMYAMCRERRAAITNLRPQRDELISGATVKDYPTGVVLVYTADDIYDAREVVAEFRKSH